MRGESILLQALAMTLILFAIGCAVQAYDARGANAPDRGSSQPTRAPQVDHLKLTIVYDNNAHDPRLRPKWGFACLVETGQSRVLFDTGGDGATLLANMQALEIDPQAIDAVVLSHIHSDHTGGLQALLDTGAKPTVYVPAAFPARFNRRVRAHTELIASHAPIEVAPGVFTSGEVGTGIVEQALVVSTHQGPVILTGCAHPGIVQMVRQAGQVMPEDPALVMGGFHLGGTSRNQVEALITELRQLGVQQVAPCHCTGDAARRWFAEAFGEDCILAGVGQVIETEGDL